MAIAATIGATLPSFLFDLVSARALPPRLLLSFVLSHFPSLLSGYLFSVTLLGTFPASGKHRAMLQTVSAPGVHPPKERTRFPLSHSLYSSFRAYPFLHLFVYFIFRFRFGSFCFVSCLLFFSPFFVHLFFPRAYPLLRSKRREHILSVPPF